VKPIVKPTVKLVTLLKIAAALLAVAVAAPQNPWTAPAGGAGTHGDSASAKTFTGRGPAGSATRATRYNLLAACPTLLFGSDKALLALCTGTCSASRTRRTR
jgi:hypothetical protein